ncbi:hypothetical protein KBY58_08295 [Cyanobium sp. HWJ4-Hawea]|nr:hypothetical protein [Cyanobium sp. WAJ14-Wanaka]MCP9809432.1 hypothetical protein [Cyanobium sp. HWJ4-Hawea]
MSNGAKSSERRFRLIDDSCQPHSQLDGQYSSLEDAIADAIEWVGHFSEPDHPTSLIGVEVSSSNGDWRTYRVPGPLLCPLPR